MRALERERERDSRGANHVGALFLVLQLVIFGVVICCGTVMFVPFAPAFFREMIALEDLHLHFMSYQKGMAASRFSSVFF